ncbi:unnamed protein product [Gongylonema pulchrum]|uniref:Peptidase_M13_N domain-containing protein n=1 Tax=Gongylonema pulchrum TaxID=637853 RepID=A0A183ER97_9BILA|nr:unnamed protein product [Gongylonema pulchrum]
MASGNGYFAQRLLHLVGGTIGFYPANAIQRRNPHNYLADFKEEEKLYSDSERLIELLAKWNCSSTAIESCLIELTQLLAQQQFWGTEEAWISDLQSIGYRFPKIESMKQIEAEYDWPNCRRAFLAFNITTDAMRDQFDSINDLYEWCNNALDDESKLETLQCKQKHPAPTAMTESLRNKALIITSNYQIKPLSYIHLYESEMHEGYFAYYCTSKAIELRLQHIDGLVKFAILS